MEKEKKMSWKDFFATNTEIDTVNLKKAYRKYIDYSNKYRQTSLNRFGIYTKEKLLIYMEQPYKYEKELRNLSNHLYSVSPQYRRTINYFANMSPLNYIIRPFKFDEEKIKKDNGKTFKSCYKKACDFLEIFNLKHEMIKAKIIAWKEDVFYGYIYRTKDSMYIRPLDANYCVISGICDGCFRYAFDFSYFDTFSDNLEFELNSFGEEFKTKYYIYKNDMNKRWQELEHNNEFCLKVSEDDMIPIIPLLGCLPAIYDIEDYKNIKLTANEIQNYKALGLVVPTSEDGLPLISDTVLDKFFQMIDNVLPENVGLYETPVKLDEISFEKNNTTTDEVNDAVTNYWNDVGVSSLLFGGDSQSSTSLKISLIADETLVYALNRQIERNVNRLLKSISGSIKFQINILDVSYYHQKDMHDLYLKDAQYGIPTKSAILSSLGIDQSILDGISFTENEFLKLVEKFVPLQSSYTTSSDNLNNNNGRPTNEDSNKDISDAGEITAERDVNEN